MAEGSWSISIPRLTLHGLSEQLEALTQRVIEVEAALEDLASQPMPKLAALLAEESPFGEVGMVAPDEMEALRARVAELESQNTHLQTIIEDQDEQIDFLRNNGEL